MPDIQLCPAGGSFKGDMSESNPTSFELKKELEEITEIIQELQKEKRNLKKVLKYTEEIEALQLLRVHKILFEKD